MALTGCFYSTAGFCIVYFSRPMQHTLHLKGCETTIVKSTYIYVTCESCQKIVKSEQYILIKCCKAVCKMEVANPELLQDEIDDDEVRFELKTSPPCDIA